MDRTEAQKSGAVAEVATVRRTHDGAPPFCSAAALKVEETLGSPEADKDSSGA